MTKVTVKATGQVFYCFESKSQPGTWHRTTIAGCSCKGFTNHGHCWHFDTVSALTNTARIEAFRLVAGWLGEVERRETVAAWNNAAVAETEAAMAETEASQASAALVLAERSERTLANVTTSQEHALVIAACWPVTALVLAGMAGQTALQAKREREDKYDWHRMDGFAA